MKRGIVVLSMSVICLVILQSCGKNSFIGSIDKSKGKEAEKPAENSNQSKPVEAPSPQTEITELTNLLNDKVCAENLGKILKKTALPLRNVQDLRAIKDGEHYELQNDIALPDNWEPIKVATVGTDIQQNLGLIINGKNHKLSGLRVTDIKYLRMGLFDLLSCAAVFDLSISDVFIRGGESHIAGSLAAGGYNLVALNVMVERIDIESLVAGSLVAVANGVGVAFRKITVRDAKLEAPFVRAVAGGVTGTFQGYADQLAVSDSRISAGKSGVGVNVFAAGIFGTVYGKSDLNAMSVSNSNIQTKSTEANSEKYCCGRSTRSSYKRCGSEMERF